MGKSFKLLTAISWAAICAPALAGEKPLVGPPPAWVAPAPDVLAKPISPASASIPLFDEQFYIDGDTAIGYIDTALVVSSPEMLNKLGTVSLSWQPAHGDLTVHAVDIVRDGKRISVLGDGSDFSVLRREARLEQQTLDGTLTAVKTIEGLRLGDVLRTAYSVSTRDSVLGGKAQTAAVLLPQPTKILFGRARLVWPAQSKVAFKSLLPGIALSPQPAAGNLKEIAVKLPVAKLAEVPGNVPDRFKPVPVIEATSFASWEEVAAVMAPLYRTEGAIAEGSELAKLTDAIAAAHADPVVRTAEALRVVQGDVRYQLIAMGTGNYEPQRPAETWEKRYGDCKAKTLLLLAMLHRMKIAAVPVLASISSGDLVPGRLPAPQAFDHVFVRADIGKESFWLDGTGLGARLADIRDVPRFGHVLPVQPRGAQPVKLPVRANARAATDVDIAFDGSAGPHLPMPFTLKIRYTGASAEQLRAAEAGGNDEMLEGYAANAAKTWAGTTTIGKPSGKYDQADASWTLSVDGMANANWSIRDGGRSLSLTPAIKVEFAPDRSKATWRDIPALIDNPWTAHIRRTLKLPERAAKATLEGMDPVSLALPAVFYERKISREGTTIVEEVTSQETGAEVAGNEIGATRKAIADAMAKTLRIDLPNDYPQQWDDVELVRNSPALARIKAVLDGRIAEKPDDADRVAERARLSGQLLDWAADEADLGKAIALDPSAARYLERSNVRATRGDVAGALKDAKAAFDLDPDDKNVRGGHASALAAAGKTAEALALLDPVPDLASEEGASAALDRAEILARGKRYPEVIALLDSALVKNASSPALLNGRCWFKALANVDLDAALADCTRAIELSADPAAYFDSRAMVHYRAGRLKDARADLDAALAIEPNLSPTRFMRGIVQTLGGDSKAGSEDLSAARKLYPAIDAFFLRYGIKP